MAIAWDIFFIVVGSSVLHATWNFFARRTKGNLAVYWLGSWVSILVALPFVIYIMIEVDQSFLDWTQFVFMLSTGVIHFFYFLALNEAYRFGAVSIVYPIARGSGVALLAVAALLFLDESLSVFGALGVFLIIFGVLLIGLAADYNIAHIIRDKLMKRKGVQDPSSYSVVDAVGPIATPRQASTTNTVGADEENEENENTIQLEESPKTDENHASNLSDVRLDDEEQATSTKTTSKKTITATTSISPIPTSTSTPALPTTGVSTLSEGLKSIIYALCVGVTICLYSLVDKMAIHSPYVKPINPLVHSFFLTFLTNVLLAPYCLTRKRDQFQTAFKEYKKYIPFVGPLSMMCYLAILYAYKSTPATYVVAVRELGIVIGSILGFVFLKEHVSIQKIVGICLVVAGILGVKLLAN